jgi:hypothetical protein
MPALSPPAAGILVGGLLSPNNRAFAISDFGVAPHTDISIGYHYTILVVIDAVTLLAAGIERLARRQRFLLGLARSRAVRGVWALLWLAQAFARAFDDQRVIVAAARTLLNVAAKISIICTFANSTNNAQVRSNNLGTFMCRDPCAGA